MTKKTNNPKDLENKRVFDYGLNSDGDLRI